MERFALQGEDTGVDQRIAHQLVGRDLAEGVDIALIDDMAEFLPSALDVPVAADDLGHRGEAGLAAGGRFGAPLR